MPCWFEIRGHPPIHHPIIHIRTRRSYRPRDRLHDAKFGFRLSLARLGPKRVRIINPIPPSSRITTNTRSFGGGLRIIMTTRWFMYSPLIFFLVASCSTFDSSPISLTTRNRPTNLNPDCLSHHPWQISRYHHLSSMTPKPFYCREFREFTAHVLQDNALMRPTDLLVQPSQRRSRKLHLITTQAT